MRKKKERERERGGEWLACCKNSNVKLTLLACGWTDCSWKRLLQIGREGSLPCFAQI